MSNPLGVDHVICLTLDKRIGIAYDLQESFMKRGYKFEMFIGGDGKTLPRDMYNIIDSNELPLWYRESVNYSKWFQLPNAANAWRAHKALMEMCLERQYESILLVEDDAVLMDNFDTALPHVEEFARNTDWSLFYIGSFYDEKKPTMVHPLVARVNNSIMGFHAVAIKNHIIQKLVRWPQIGPMDYICSEYMVKYFPSYVCVPPPIVQRGGWSYCEGHFLGRRAEDNYH